MAHVWKQHKVFKELLKTFPSKKNKGEFEVNWTFEFPMKNE